MNTSTRSELVAEADRLTTLGIKHHKALRLNESEDLRRQALAVLEQALGPEDPVIAEKLNDLAWVLSRNGKHEEAERVLRRSLAFLDQPYHPRQRTVLTTLGHLAKYAD